MAGPIYKPSGRALEYSDLALNLYTGCLYGCKYCYSPEVCHKKRETFHTDVRPRENILEKLEAQCKIMKGDPRDILLCFTCDPYQPILDDITRYALLILEKYEMKVQILTKGGVRALRDFDILKRNNWKFGTTLLFYDDETGQNLKDQWEPNAAEIYNRISAINQANLLGIYTWISVEPVINPTQALHVILELRDIVDHFKIGKINYHKYIEKRIDWNRFLQDVQSLLWNKNFYVKLDLKEAAKNVQEVLDNAT